MLGYRSGNEAVKRNSDRKWSIRNQVPRKNAPHLVEPEDANASQAAASKADSNKKIGRPISAATQRQIEQAITLYCQLTLKSPFFGWDEFCSKCWELQDLLGTKDKLIKDNILRAFRQRSNTGTDARIAELFKTDW